MSQFNYCPLVWMCHSRGLNNKINNIHKRVLRIVYQDKKSNIQYLLQKYKSVSIHMKNLQYLATEIYKVKYYLSPKTMKDIFFSKNEIYSFWSGTHLVNRNIHAVHFGTDTITNLGPKIWKLVPDKIKNASSLLVFKSRIKHGPLITALADSVKLLFNILILLKSFQISVSSQKLDVRTKKLS